MYDHTWRYMTPGLSMDIWCHVRPCFFLNLQITGSGIRPHTKWSVSLVIAYGNFNLPRVCVGMHELTYSLYLPQGNSVQDVM